jgi:hypothetical protein
MGDASILGWRCYYPGDLNPQLNRFTFNDILANTALARTVSNPMSLYGEAIRRLIRPDITRHSKSRGIIAVVLGGKVVEGQEALSYNLNIESLSAGASANRLQMLYVRVPELTELADPYCGDNSLTPAQVKALVEMHPVAAVPNWAATQPTIIPGTLVEVKFIEGHSRAIVKNILEEATDLQSMIQALAASGAFALGGAGILLQPTQTPAQVKECAEKYDNPPPPLTTVPNAAQHTSYLEKLHPEFIPYAKCFLWRAYDDLGATIRINSSYRSLQEQQVLRDRYMACKGTKPCLPASRPGSSHHNFGWAVDFNPTLKAGNMVMSTASKAEWEASGIPALLTSIGLYWGGYMTNYDPIHFDGSKLITESTSQLFARAKVESVANNQLEIELKV